MPNRIVREGIISSDRVNTLSWEAEVLYRRLINVVDDFGRYDGRPTVVRASCFPLRLEKVREADISRWIAECEKAGLIALYVVDGKPFMEIFNLGEPRAKYSKFPPNPRSARACEHLRADAPVCALRLSNAPIDLSLASESDPPSGGRGKNGGFVKKGKAKLQVRIRRNHDPGTGNPSG